MEYQLSVQELDSDKLIELKRKTYWIFYQNRVILKNFFFNSKLRQFQVTKFFSKFIKKSGYDLFNFFENSLFNVLVRAKFIYSWKDSIFLIKNGYVFVNGRVSRNMFLTVNLNDFIQICIGNDYFNFFKKNLNSNLKLMNNMVNKVWQINRLRGNFYKQTTSHIGSWINELMFFYDDVPDHIEVDYSILTLAIVYVNYNFNNYNFFLMKFLNCFMVRHYNWKYIV
jgi:ribosomal protein S4